MKFLVTAFLLVLFLSPTPYLHAQVRPSSEAGPIVTKVDHFFVFADAARAEKLFKLFRDEFHLPQVWAFRKYGSYASGAVSLGNVVLEFATMEDPKNPNPITEFQGIVFEPVGDATTSLASLKSRGVPTKIPIPKIPAGRSSPSLRSHRKMFF